MTKLRFSTTIDAPRDVIWNTMLQDETYRQWTRVFQEGSYAVTDWKQGSKALFLSPEGGGMVSRVAEHRPNEYLSLEHIGIVKDGREITDGDDVAGWAGARENYTLREHDGFLALDIEMDTTDEHKQYFVDTWPKALATLKAMAEERRESR